MNSSRTIGIILVSIGIIMMIYTGFTYFTTENVANIGPIHINKEKSHSISWPPIIGVVLLIAGLMAFFTGKKA